MKKTSIGLSVLISMICIPPILCMASCALTETDKTDQYITNMLEDFYVSPSVIDEDLHYLDKTNFTMEKLDWLYFSNDPNATAVDIEVSLPITAENRSEYFSSKHPLEEAVLDKTTLYQYAYFPTSDNSRMTYYRQIQSGESSLESIVNKYISSSDFIAQVFFTGERTAHFELTKGSAAGIYLGPTNMGDFSEKSIKDILFEIKNDLVESDLDLSKTRIIGISSGFGPYRYNQFLLTDGKNEYLVYPLRYVFKSSEYYFTQAEYSDEFEFTFEANRLYDVKKDLIDFFIEELESRMH